MTSSQHTATIWTAKCRDRRRPGARKRDETPPTDGVDSPAAEMSSDGWRALVVGRRSLEESRRKRRRRRPVDVSVRAAGDANDAAAAAAAGDAVVSRWTPLGSLRRRMACWRQHRPRLSQNAISLLSALWRIWTLGQRFQPYTLIIIFWASARYVQKSPAAINLNGINTKPKENKVKKAYKMFYLKRNAIQCVGLSDLSIVIKNRFLNFISKLQALALFSWSAGLCFCELCLAKWLWLVQWFHFFSLYYVSFSVVLLDGNN